MNRSLFSIFFSQALLVSCTTHASSTEETVDTETHKTLILDYVRDYEVLKIPALQLSFVQNLNSLGSPEDLKRQEIVLSDYLRKFSAIDMTSIDICEKIDIETARQQIKTSLNRAKLGQEFLGGNGSVGTATRLNDVALSNQWYRLFLEAWNGSALEPDELFVFGKVELQKAVSEYDQIQAELGFTGDDAGLRAHLARLAAKPATDQETKALFQSKQRLVRQNMSRLFPDIKVPFANIKASDRGASFPVPGYYEQDSMSFFYNDFGKSFEARQADWLFLHEASPGHHYQLIGANVTPHCTSQVPAQMYPAFSEGWAAYVENLGEELGLYNSPEARLAAVEWNMVRSARVSLDVGLNFYGWSDDEALSFWNENIRGQKDIAQREIDRMRRWPVQVITYKYGANIFEQIYSGLSSKSDAEEKIKTFHGAVIGYGNMPVSVFKKLSQEILDHADHASSRNFDAQGNAMEPRL